ncbi:hypothetical protein AcW1_007297, partial [Taiwanofungus camphoratus]
DQVKTFALQVYEPASYQGPQDASQLGTIWLAYIPTDDVNNLAQQIRDENSPFYTALGTPYSTLAQHVIPSFAVDSVPAPGSGSGGGSSSDNSASTSSASSQSKTREDAIIGVVSSLGGITVIALTFVVVRAIKQRRELAHRRIAEPAGDPAEYSGERPDGQEFDRDSLGGQRRRSFYYAADSLRGFQETAAVAATTFDDGMRERRTVAPGMISTPILRENTMSW